MSRTGVIAAIMAVSVAGCTTVGPDYHRPAAAANNAAAAQGAWREGGAQTSPQALPPRWWHLFNDPVLDRLEQQALAANTDLRVAAASLARARAVASIAESARDIDLGVGASVERARLSGESYLLSDQLPVMNLGDVSAQARYQIDLVGGIKRSIEAANADADATAQTVRAVQVTLAADVARAYLAQCGAAASQAIAEQSLALQQRHLMVVQRLVQAGKISASEVAVGEARVDQARAAIPLLAARSRAALYQLAYLTGTTPAQYPREAQACRVVPSPLTALPVGDGAALLRRRPDVAIAERRLAAATARIGVATADLYPRVALGLSAGSVGKFGDLGEPATNTWSVGPLIHWTIPGGGARVRIRAAKAEADGALARFDGTVLAALKETETALAAYAQHHDRTLALDASAAAAERAAADARVLRRAGKASVLSALDAEQATIIAQANAQAAREDLAQAQVGVFLALGGGW